MKLFSGTSNPTLTQDLCQKLSLPTGKVEIVHFSDGEIRVRIEEEVTREDVVFVQSFAGAVNDFLVEAFLFVDAVHDLGAQGVIGVFPYLPYARQNKAHRPGEGVSAKTVSTIFQQLGLSSLITYDIHSENALSFFTIPTHNIPILPILISEIVKETNHADIVVVSPDQDGSKRAKEAAIGLGFPHAFVQKERDLSKIDELKEIHGEKIMGDVKGKTVILADDTIATGSTLIQAAKYVREEGAKTIYACATHGIFTRGFELVTSDQSIEKVYISDSIHHTQLPEKIISISTAEILLKNLQAIST